MTNLIRGWRRMFLQKAGGRDNEAGSTKSALLRVVGDVCLHYRAEGIAFGQRLDSGDVPSLGIDRQHRAGINRLAVEEHGASPAGSAVADALGARQVEVLA